jgi:predicted O-linked N-acetylglucosamine transferase (SPINDLY family)
MPNDAKRAAISRLPSRHEAGLPESGFVFCCFNGNYKIAPQIFDVWMRLLRGVAGSVLWLPKPNDAAANNLRREAEARGMDAERIVFAPFVTETADHLARLALADLFLDTLPYGAHSTACDALWIGLPLVTCEGGTFAGRVASSVLRCAGLPELVTQSLDDYEALALRLAREPAALGEIKDKLKQNRTASPLFDTQRFCGNLERAYTAMWERHMRGDAPSHFSVTASERSTF